MSKQHTPTHPIPWTKDEWMSELTVRDANRDYVFSIRIAVDPNGKRDSINRILKAVNNHDRLVEALEETLDLLESSDIEVPNWFGEMFGNVVQDNRELLAELKA